MSQLKHLRVDQYLEKLSSRTPAPGGGSAAALTAALGVSLFCMVAEYSVGKSNHKETDTLLKKVLKECKKIQRKLTDLIDLDAQAYQEVVKSRKGTESEKKKALLQARKVPYEVCKLCFSAVEKSNILITHGNAHLISDVQVGLEMLVAAFESSRINIHVNS